MLRSQCLDRRIAPPPPGQLVSEIAAWERQRNAAKARIGWMFTTEKARAKIGRAYPQIDGVQNAPASEYFMRQINIKKRSFFWVRLFVSSPRLTPHLILMLSADKGGVLKGDLASWAEALDFEKPQKIIDFMTLFIIFMTFNREFRNIFYYRLGIKARLFSWMCPPLQSLEINANYIGPGLFIQHGNGTLISAERIGANCRISQQVTIGHTNPTARPTIGNNVRIGPGAKVIGDIKIGDNVTICPNTVVLEDASPGVTLLGVPGRVIWKRPS